jgi:DsbC/DsbD-like thiol-disulfide interchange protein
MKRYALGLFFAAGLAFAWAADSDAGGGTKSASKVKATVEASKIEKDGKQTVTITLAIEKGWHLYANPVNNDDQKQAQTTVRVKGKVSDVRVKYPEGKTHGDKNDKCDIYEGTIKIPVTLTRAVGDTTALEINVALQACNDNTCLLPSTIKLMVP